MTQEQYKIFSIFRNELREYCTNFAKQFGEELIPIQKIASQSEKLNYEIENPVVYNTALDEITQDSNITKIVIGDNPGKNEQLNCNQKYLVGQAGKLAQGFFEKSPEFETDFRKNVIILNKTPLHSGKTNQLKQIKSAASPKLKAKIDESIIWMAQKTAKLHHDLCLLTPENQDLPEVWLVGYSELKNKGLFVNYRDELKKSYTNSQNQAFWDKVLVFQHFSMNRFTVDLKNYMTQNDLTDKKLAIEQLGRLHKQEIFE